MVAYSNQTMSQFYQSPDPTRIPDAMDFVRQFGFQGGGAGTSYQQSVDAFGAKARAAVDRVGGTYTTQSSGSGGVGGGASSVMADYESKYNQARAANESRYNEILAGYRNRYTRNLATLQGVGEQQKADTDAAFRAQASRAGQDMVSRGLTGTTIKPTIETGIEAERVGAQNRLAESLAMQRIGLDSQLDEDTLRFMERRTDAYPDSNLYLKLLEMEARNTPSEQGASLYESGPTGSTTAPSLYSMWQSGALNGLRYSQPTRGGTVDGVPGSAFLQASAPVPKWSYNGQTYTDPSKLLSDRERGRQSQSTRKAMRKDERSRQRAASQARADAERAQMVQEAWARAYARQSGAGSFGSVPAVGYGFYSR